MAKKKYLLMLPAATMIAIPLITVVSCSESKEKQKLWTQLGTNWDELNGGGSITDKSPILDSKVNARNKRFSKFIKIYKNVESNFAKDWKRLIWQGGDKITPNTIMKVDKGIKLTPSQLHANWNKMYNQNKLNKIPKSGLFKAMYSRALLDSESKHSQKDKDKVILFTLVKIMNSYARNQINAKPEDGGYSAILDWCWSARSSFWNEIVEWSQAYKSNTYAMVGGSKVTNQLYKNHDVILLIKKIASLLIDDKFYFPQQQEYVNWWQYEIGFPKILINMLSGVQTGLSSSELAKYMSGYNYFMPDLLYGHASKGAINNYKPTNKLLNTGGNLADNAIIALKAAILSRDEKAIFHIVETVYKYMFKNFVEAGDGFYRDGGFIQHGNIGYMSSYGGVLMDDVANMALLLKNTKFDIFEMIPEYNNIFSIIEKSIMPLMYHGMMSPSTGGRSIGRVGTNSSLDGIGILTSIAKLNKFASRDHKNKISVFISNQVTNMMSTQKNKALKNKWLKVYDGISKTQNIGDYSSIEETTQQIWSIDRFIKRNKNYLLTTSMHSKRTGNFEAMNGENLQGFYHGEGMTLLTKKENPFIFDSDYWIGINPYYVPGVTSDFSNHKISDFDPWLPANKGKQDDWKTRIESLSQKQRNNEAGGTTMGKMHALFANMTNFDNSLNTSKSMFSIGGQTLVLGSTSRSGSNISTTIDNRVTTTNAIGKYTLGPKNGKWQPVLYNGENNESVGYVIYGNGAKVQQTHEQTNRNIQLSYRGYKTNITSASKDTVDILRSNGSPTKDYTRLVKDSSGNMVRPPLQFNRKYYNRLFINNDTNSTRNFAYSIVPDAKNNKDMIDATKNIKIIHNTQEVSAIEYKDKDGSEYLMINFMGDYGQNAEFDFFSTEKDSDGNIIPVSLSATKACSLIFKKTMTKSGKVKFLASTRSSDQSSNFKLKFSKNISYLKGPWIDWKETEDKVENNHSMKKSLSNLGINIQTVEWDRVKLDENQEEYFVNKDTMMVIPDKRYKYNNVIEFELILN